MFRKYFTVETLHGVHRVAVHIKMFGKQYNSRTALLDKICHRLSVG